MGKLRHVIETQQFDRETLAELFRTTNEMRAVMWQGGTDAMKGKIMATVFYQPSTRTRMSFESAMLRLGGSVISTDHAGEFSSAAKGESLKDTIKNIMSYAHVIVLRHPLEGSAAEAAEVSSVPIINAGDGTGQHPTQALLDLYTIERELGRIDGITVALVGDLAHGRTVRSLAYLLAKFAVKKLYFVAGQALRVKDDILEYLNRHGVAYEVTDALAQVVGDADIIYITRLQREYFTGPPEQFEEAYRQIFLTPEILTRLKPEARILHPLPRNNEIDEAIDGDPRAAYFRQSAYGVPVRMALIKMLLIA